MGSLITTPHSLGLEALFAGLVGAAAFMGFAIIIEVSSFALEEEEVSSTSFSSLLLLTLLSSEIGERFFCSFLFLLLFRRF